MAPTTVKTTCNVTPNILKGNNINQKKNKRKNMAIPNGQQQAIKQKTRKNIKRVFIVDSFYLSNSNQILNHLYQLIYNQILTKYLFGMTV